MIEPKFIKSGKYETKSQRYDELLAEGIEWIQKFSGNQWTDFNYHDPGITFLEQICFAITDLGYKSNFPIEDILFIGKDKFDLENKNLFIPPHKIFPSSPLTASDYRKIIVDRVSNVQNAWVYSDKDNLRNIAGLFKVKVQLVENLDHKAFLNTLKEVDDLLMANRSIGTDFIQAEPLKKDEIRFECDILLDSFAVGEQVLANIYKRVEESISNKPKFIDYKDVENERVVEDLFTGPFTQKGYLENFEFNEKTSEIYISEIKEILYNVDGVLGVENLTFYKNGIKIFDDYIPFDNDSYPSLKKLDNDFFDESNKEINFYRNESFYKIDQVIFQQIYDSLIIERSKVYDQKLTNDLNLVEGRFKKEEFEKYYSIMRELPALYGLREDELPSKSPNLRKAQVNQLRSYLLLFDQLMANHVSQLSNIRELFSVDLKSNKTIFGQIPTDVPNLTKVIGVDLPGYQSKLENALESKNDFFKRKNKVLDHMLARFGETFDTFLLEKIHKLQYDTLSENEIKRFGLSAKINFAKSIVDLGQKRSLSSDYTKDYINDKNISGLENRLKLKLGISKNISDSTIKPFSSGSTLGETEYNWRKKTIKIDDGPSLEVYSLVKKAYEDKKIHFFLNSTKSFKLLFLNGIKRKSYTIVKVNNIYSVLFNGIDSFQPAVIFQSFDFEECNENILKTIEKLNAYNSDTEGFLMIENVLLRPVASNQYTLFIKNEDQVQSFESYFTADLDHLRDLKKDFSIIAVDKKNYNVVKKLNSKNYEIIIYDLLNKPLFRSCVSYKNEADAKSEIPMIIQSFNVIIGANQLDEFCEMIVVNDLTSSFPDDFNYSNHINFIFPEWPLRFQNKEFKKHINQIVEEYIPANLTFDTFYLNIDKMNNFEQTHSKWIKHKKLNKYDQLDSKSLQIIQLLQNYKKNEG